MWLWISCSVAGLMFFCSSVPDAALVDAAWKWTHRIFAQCASHQPVSATPPRYVPYGA